MPISEGQKKAFREHFNKWDKDGDGKISSKDLRALFAELEVELTDDDIEEIMADTDKNKDGLITFEEFCAAKKKSMLK
ncbi:unnamed protein product [Brachionus calyciflorus]|uniref:EF-hand domain-containing protein n=1 Tax=Brachionus calyciflorus TaxID=104777 RepID=A0A813RG76_9BILA|nr:unnamed protein product [Brachionus calyciflorus]